MGIQHLTQDDVVNSEDVRSERRFRLLAEAIPQIVWTTRAEGYCDYQNRRWFDYSGMTAEESAGAGWMDAVHPEDRARLGPAWTQTFKGSKGFEFEYRLRRADGVFRWFLARAEPICDDENKVVRWFGTCTDIDDRRRAEDEALRRDGDRLRLAAEAARLGYWDWNILSDTITWSESLEKISATSPEAFGGTFESFLAVVHPHDRDRVGAAVRVAVARGTPYEEEFRLARPDGSYRWCLTKGQAYYDRDGRAVRMSGIDVDITARKEAEERLKLSEERFRASVDTLIDCFAIYTAVRDERGVITDFRTEYVNLPACRNNLMTREQQVGRGLLELLPAHRESGLFDRYCRVVETGEPLDIEKIFYEDVFGGERLGRVFAIRVSKLNDGYVAAWRDITERKRAEEALQENLKFAQRIADISPAVLYVYDLVEDRPVYHNREVATLLGYSLEEILALGRDAVSTLMHPEDQLRLPAHFSKARELRDGENATFEFRMKDANGEWCWFYAHDSVFSRDVDGRAAQLIGAAVDISARKRSEEALRASEERFRMAADAFDGIIYEWDARTNRVERSSGLFAITGFRPEEAEPSGNWWWSRVHPDDFDGAERAFLASVECGAPLWDAEYRVRHRDGSYRTVWDRARTIYDDRGRPARIVGCTIDITEHRRAIAALQETERRFRKLADSNVIGVIFGDVHGGIRYANDEYLRILGYSRDEFESDRVGWASVTPPDWLPVDERAIAQAKGGDGACAPYEKEYVRKDGTRISVLVGFTLFGEEETVAFILDISERKRAEAALRESEERLSLAIEGSRLGMWDWDLRSGHVLWNRHHEAIFGYEPGQPLRDYRDFADRLSPDDLQAIEADFREAMDARTEYRFTHRVIWPSGTIRWVEGHGRFYYDADGRPVRSLGILTDITDLKRAEELLREADRRKDEFLAMLAHELRNPLSALSNAFRLLRLPALADHDRQSAYDIAERQLHNLVRLIDDLLDVARISTGKIHLKKARLDAAMVVARAVESVRPFIEAQGHELTVSVEGGPLPLECDPTRLEQILANLLNNAAKYTDEGGRIWLSAGTEGGEVVIRVRDNGVGIAPEMQPKLFDLFAQVDTSVDRSHGGLGIGLAIVRMLVEMHGGRVSATSEGPGKGSEFTIRLSLSPHEADTGSEAANLTAAEPPCQAKSCRILLVDDNFDSLQSMALLLELNGHEVVTAQDGPTAVVAAREFRPDVVLLDIGLPGMSGYDVAETMRREGMTDALLIAVSGYTREKDRERARHAGFNHHLSKPVELGSLLAIIKGPGSPSC